MLLIAAMLLQASPATAQQWNRNAVKRALQATVLVLVPDDNGDLFDSGSGTVLDAERGIILTNYHVMGDTDKAELYNRMASPTSLSIRLICAVRRSSSTLPR